MDLGRVALAFTAPVTAPRPTWPSCCLGTGSRRRLEDRLRVRAVESSTLVADTNSLTR